MTDISSIITEPYPGWLIEAVNAKEASRITGVPVDSLATYRCRGGGPDFFNPEGTRLIRYIRKSLYIWLIGSKGPLKNTAEKAQPLNEEIDEGHE